MKPLKVIEIIRRFEKHKVKYVIIGGVAAALHGSSELTRDFDVCIKFDEENWKRILDALAGTLPHYVMSLDHRPLDKSAAQLAKFRNMYLSTEIGRIEFFGEVTPLGTYDEVQLRAVQMQLEQTLCATPSMDDLITVKEFVGRPKDRLIATELRAIRDRLRSP